MTPTRSALILINVARLLLIITSAAVLGLGLWRAPRVVMILAGVAAAAWLVRRAQQTAEPPVLPEEPAPEKVEGEPIVLPVTDPIAEPDPVPARVMEAMNQGRRELGQTSLEDDSDIEFETMDGHCRVRVGYSREVPYIALRQIIGDDTEMAFIIRRRRSTLGLPRVVDNTPVESARFEYRLRTMDLGEELDHAFDAATNRPRLFRELMDSGFRSELSYLRFHPKYRLEDLVYGGDSLTLIMHPAADPSVHPFLHDSVAFAQPIAQHLREFIGASKIPTAQS